MTRIQDSLVSAMGRQRGVAAADRLCVACVDLFAIDAAAISLVFDRVNTGTLGASSPHARSYDELQFVVGEGPCLDSALTHMPILVRDLEDVGPTGGRRWPAYTPAMLAHGMRGVFSMPVPVAGQHVGALDLFRAAPGALHGDELAGALIAAELAELSLLDLLPEDLQAAVSDPSSDAWAEINTITRVEVSQATGMLVGQLNVTPAEALAWLRAHAYAAGCSATKVAYDILSGRLTLDSD